MLFGRSRVDLTNGPRSAVLAVRGVRGVQAAALPTARGFDATASDLAGHRDRDRAQRCRHAQKHERDRVESTGERQREGQHEPDRDDDRGRRAQGSSTMTVPFMPCSSWGMQKYWYVPESSNVNRYDSPCLKRPSWRSSRAARSFAKPPLAK